VFSFSQYFTETLNSFLTGKSDTKYSETQQISLQCINRRVEMPTHIVDELKKIQKIATM
jgi:uncharacterized protein YukE